MDKDANLWLDGAEPPPYYYLNSLKLANSKLLPTKTQVAFSGANVSPKSAKPTAKFDVLINL